MLCVDEEFSGFNREGRGQALFNADGTPSVYVESILKFLRDYQTQFQTTQRRFCNRLRDLGLLETTTVQVTPDSGGPLSLGGFMAVSRDKLKAAFARRDVGRTGENGMSLNWIYMHLNSLRNFGSSAGSVERAGHAAAHDQLMTRGAG